MLLALKVPRTVVVEQVIVCGQGCTQRQCARHPCPWCLSAGHCAYCYWRQRQKCCRLQQGHRAGHGHPQRAHKEGSPASFIILRRWVCSFVQFGPFCSCLSVFCSVIPSLCPVCISFVVCKSVCPLPRPTQPPTPSSSLWCATFTLLLLLCCLVSSDVCWHIRDKLRPMHEHGSILLCIHGNQKSR